MTPEQQINGIKSVFEIIAKIIVHECEGNSPEDKGMLLVGLSSALLCWSAEQSDNFEKFIETVYTLAKQTTEN